MQLLLMQIPKAQKDIDDLTDFTILGSAHLKAASKHVGEIDHWWS